VQGKKEKRKSPLLKPVCLKAKSKSQNKKNQKCDH
jgi:hypothetical protein